MVAQVESKMKTEILAKIKEATESEAERATGEGLARGGPCPCLLDRGVHPRSDCDTCQC